MKYSNKFLYTLIALVGIFGCTQNDSGTNDFVTVLNIDPTKASESIDLSSMVDSVSYIKLETAPKSIMGRITQLIVKRHYIYVADVQQDMVFVFDKKGQFVSCLDQKGRGEGEYVNLGFILIDESETYLEVLELGGNNSRRLRYSVPEFDLLDEELMYIPSATSCIKVDNLYYFAAQQNDNVVNGKPTNASVVIVDPVSSSQDILFHKNILTGHQNYSFFTESFTRNEAGKLFVSVPFDRTFYQLSEWNAQPVLTVDFGGYGIDQTIGLKNTEEQLRYFEKDASNLAFFPILNANTDKLLAIFYNYAEEGSIGQQYIHLKESNEVIHTKKIIDDFTVFSDRFYLCSSSIPFNHEILYDEDYLVDIIEPSNYLQEKNAMILDGIGKITDQDNPIILLMKLKGG